MPVDPRPDPAALLLGHLAELNGTDDDYWIEGTAAELAWTLHRIGKVAEVLLQRSREIQESLAARMESDKLTVSGLGRVKRELTHTSTWKDAEAAERMRDDITTAVSKSVAIDEVTGDIDPMRRNAAAQAVRMIWEVVPSFSEMKVAGRSRLGLYNRDYRSYTDRYKVTIETWEDA